MKNLVLFLLSLLCACTAIAQKQAIMPFGQIDTADLRMTSCDFEKGATAEVLFDKADNYACADSVVMMRHRRIKLFKGYDKDLTTIKLTYYSYRDFEKITDISAQTINLVNNTIVITKIDPKLIYTQAVDKSKSSIVFVFPEVKEGSVIEYRYKWKTHSAGNFPSWSFQGTIPTRYSQLQTKMFDDIRYNIISRGYQKFAVDTNELAYNKKGVAKGRKLTWAKSNVPAAVKEPFVNIGNVNFQYLSFQLHSVDLGYAGVHHASGDQWFKIALDVMHDEDFGQQLDVGLSKEDQLIDHANSLKTDDERIAYLFNEVKKSMKWNNVDAWYTIDGVHRAWSKKTGNSTEINLILYHLLKKVGVDVYPMMVSTRDNGTIYSEYASFSQINKAVAYVQVDSTKYYVLDASGKYNVYNEVPVELLNTLGLMLGLKGLMACQMKLLKNDKPALQSILINGEIFPDSKLSGTVAVANYSYNRAAHQAIYDYAGEDKYKEGLTEGDTRLKISNLKFDNMEADSLPLIEKFDFKKDLAGDDDKYIYVNPNQFGPMKTNPFLSEERFSDIDFTCCNYYTINGNYKIPAGYKIEALPKNTTLNMIDKSISFKRVIAEADGLLQVIFIISSKRSLYTVEEYKGLHDFYKKMFEMMNEPVVLKKAS